MSCRGKIAVFPPAIAAALMWSFNPTHAQEPCADQTLFEPYQQVCAPISDKRDWWLNPSDEMGLSSLIDGSPEAGTINAGTEYLSGALFANRSARLHTRMFVHPDGLAPTGFLDWTFMPATNRVDSAVEVVAIYRTALGDRGVLSIFGRPCSEEFPCPDGDTSNGWQPSKDFSELTCNITHFVDDGGHAQKIIHYANVSDRLDDADPPLWRNSVYLWNYCDSGWDLIWDHTYRENKRDCSVDGCYWWGTGIELPGASLRPQVAELGYEDTLLKHDGTWSELGPTETGFRRPEDRPDLSPWQLFHLDPNRAFGVGSFVDDNDAPEIVDQAPLKVDEDGELQLQTADLVIQDPDVDARFHVQFALTAFGGENYTRNGTMITPDENYFGDLQIPVSVSDGAAESETFELVVSVLPVNDTPVFTSSAPVTATQLQSYSYTIETHDPDGEAGTIQGSVVPSWLTLVDHGDGSATISGVPGAANIGNNQVSISVIDAGGLSATQTFTITVVEASGTRPAKKKGGGGVFDAVFLGFLVLLVWVAMHRRSVRRHTH